VMTTETAPGRQFLLPAAAAMAGDLRQTLMHDRESTRMAGNALLPGFRSGPAIDTFDRRQQQHQPPELPDFSHRPDKYAYEPWKDQPELIPKGRSYYEHDDREREDMADDRWNPRFGGGRGRGRGFSGGWRGRGGGFRRESFDRPPPPRRSYYGGREDTWKHDKFVEMYDPTASTG